MDAERNRDGERQRQRYAEQQQGVEQTRLKHFQHRPADEPRIAQVALKCGGQPVQVAGPDRQVEPVERAQPCRVGRRQDGVGVDHQVDRIARHQPDQPIDQERHDQQDDQRLKQPHRDESQHLRRPFLCLLNATARPTSWKHTDGRSAARLPARAA